MSSKANEAAPPRISAEELRAKMTQKQMEEAEKTLKLKRKHEEELKEFETHFMTSKISEGERQQIREKVYRLAEQGQSELMVLSFPSEFCSDGGRAINNKEPEWPKSLTGRAKHAFELWEENAKPLGFKLEARVMNYPKGIIGEIGLFVLW
jgi:hypothetical protein